MSVNPYHNISSFIGFRTNSSKVEENIQTVKEIFEPEENTENMAKVDVILPLRPIVLTLASTFRTFEWAKPYEPVELTFSTIQQILYPSLPQ